MTYAFTFCEVCNESRLECKGTRNMCTRCRRDKKVPKVWSGENNMDAMAVPEILSNMSDAEQMLIARLAPTVHVHLLKHGGIASKGHCIAFPQAVQEPATILPRLQEYVDLIRVRRQGKMIPIRTSGLEDTVLKKPFVGSRTTILLMVMLLMALA